MTIRSTIEPRPRWIGFCRDRRVDSQFLSRLLVYSRSRSVAVPVGKMINTAVSASDVVVGLGEILDGFAERIFVLNSRLQFLFANTIGLSRWFGATRPSGGGSGPDRFACDGANCLPGHRPWQRRLVATRDGVNPSVSQCGCLDEQLIGYECEDGSRRLLAVTVREIGRSSHIRAEW